ncbi:UNVERIFIED_CONTAM: hypothetical protein PYX00_006383 [Menopon gallinae]|uniref:Aromatic-L-amino-acid decarboxylase n=1 Tax=Menopon gallinae TaxID=328185 RepID=A0AAW2HX01_9NEOP
MNVEEFRRYGKELIDFIADYIENSRDFPVLPSSEPGYLQNLIPREAPEESEKWDDIMKDVVKYILPGMTHWQSPHFHAYFPAGQSYPSILGELLSAGLGTVEFTWLSSPISTELEVIVMDWLGKLIGLPDEFLNCSDGKGGGIIQGSASETVFVCLLAAKQRMLKRLLEQDPNLDPDVIKQKMVAYSSDQSNSCVEKAGRLGSMKMRLLKSDNNCRLRGETLLKAIKEDIENGLIPTYLCATLGTTPTCAFDRIDELSPICSQYGIWLHVDAAYAGAAFICPEYRHLMKAVETTDSFNMNPHKWLLVNFDCSAFWIKDSTWLIETLNVDRIYLDHHKRAISSARDHRNWEIPLGRRFRSLKLWFTLRSYGAKGLQKFIRYQIYLAKEFEKLVRSDVRFEIPFESSLGLICFRLKVKYFNDRKAK